MRRSLATSMSLMPCHPGVRWLCRKAMPACLAKAASTTRSRYSGKKLALPCNRRSPSRGRITSLSTHVVRVPPVLDVHRAKHRSSCLCPLLVCWRRCSFRGISCCSDIGALCNRSDVVTDAGCLKRFDRVSPAARDCWKETATAVISGENYNCTISARCMISGTMFFYRHSSISVPWLDLDEVHNCNGRLTRGPCLRPQPGASWLSVSDARVRKRSICQAGRPAPMRSAGPTAWPRIRQCTNIQAGPVGGAGQFPWRTFGDRAGVHGEGSTGRLIEGSTVSSRTCPRAEHERKSQPRPFL